MVAGGGGEAVDRFIQRSLALVLGWWRPILALRCVCVRERGISTLFSDQWCLVLVKGGGRRAIIYSFLVIPFTMVLLSDNGFLVYCAIVFRIRPFLFPVIYYTICGIHLFGWSFLFLFCINSIYTLDRIFLFYNISYLVIYTKILYLKINICGLKLGVG